MATQINQKKLRAASLLLTALATMHSGTAKAEGVGLREPLFPRRDAATAEYSKPTSLTFFTRGTRGTTGGEQELFVPLSGYGTGHVFGNLDLNTGKPNFVQAGAALKLHSALTGGVTLIAPSTAVASLTPGLKLQLEQAGITLKAAAPVELKQGEPFHRNLSGQFAVIKGFDLKALQTALRLGGGTTNDADATLSLQRRVAGLPVVVESGLKRSFGAGAATVGKGRLVVGADNLYVAGAVEGGRGVEKLFTVSLGTEFGPEGRRRREPPRKSPAQRLVGINRRPPEQRRRRRT